MAGTTAMECGYTSPVGKLVKFFEKSRNAWKAKHHAVKAMLKLEQNQRRAAEKSRSQWREKAESANRRVRELEQELVESKKQIAGNRRGEI